MHRRKINTALAHEKSAKTVSEDLTPEFEAWLAVWERWLDACLSSGIDQIGTATQTLISDWQRSASTLGFGDYAALSKQLFLEKSQEHRVLAFQRCLLAYQVLQQTINVQSLK